MSRSGNNRGATNGAAPRRAIVDIGSNTVRLVIYDGTMRVPRPIYNDKVTARLGRELEETGMIPAKAWDLALAGLARFALLIDELKVVDVEVVATAAARDAANGPQFLDEVRKLGFAPRLLSGREEAETSAEGVLGAFPGASGVVADLGGGSLELVRIDGHRAEHGTSLPLGTLRLPALRQKEGQKFAASVRKMLRKSGDVGEKGQALYLVGGSFRAFGQYAMNAMGSVLEDAHGFQLDADHARSIAAELGEAKPKQHADIKKISSSRLAMLPDTAALLTVLLEELASSRIHISAWGLREGLLYRRLGPETRALDPLISAVAAFTQDRGGSARVATMVAGWMAAIRKNGRYKGESLQLAAILLALTSRDIEPNLRRRHVLDWALHKRWMGISPTERGMLAAALLASIGSSSMPSSLSTLASVDQLREGRSWGLAVRLCQRLSGCSLGSMVRTSLEIEDDRLVLSLSGGLMPLYGENSEKDLANLASELGLKPHVRQMPPSDDQGLLA